MERIGSIEGRSVWVREMDGGQDILFECDRPCADRAFLPAGRGLMLAKVLGRERVEGSNGRWVAVVMHDEEVDRLLVELIDVLVSIRYAHPTMVQLRLSLDVEETQALGRLPLFQGHW